MNVPKDFEPVKYDLIPFSGVDLVDHLQCMFTDKSLENVSVRIPYWQQFQKICVSELLDKGISQEEKEIWVRSMISCLDAVNRVADAKDSPGVYNLSSEFIGILESVFMQSPNPICVKKLAMDIGAMYFFNQQAVVLGEEECDSAYEARMEYLSEVELDQMMGGARVFYEKKLCMNCSVENCPFDIFLRMYQETGDDNEKYASYSGEERLGSDSSTGVALSNRTPPVSFRQLEGNLVSTQPYLEALYPRFVDNNFFWKKKTDGVTNYHAYWVAYIITRLFDGISQQDIGDVFGIPNIHIYGTEAKLKETYRNSIEKIFRDKSLLVPVREDHHL